MADTVIYIPSPVAPFNALQLQSTGQYWDTVAAQWTAAPTGSGPLDAKFSLPTVQAGNAASYGVTVPEAAGASGWQVLTWYKAAPDVPDVPQGVTPNVDITFNPPTPVEPNRDLLTVPAAFVFEMTNRHDGTYKARGTIRVRQNEVVKFALDLDPFIADDTAIDGITDPPLIDCGACTIEIVGHDAKQAKFRISANSTAAGTTGYMRATVKDLEANQFVCEADIEVG